jgi:hypothetical protein
MNQNRERLSAKFAAVQSAACWGRRYLKSPCHMVICLVSDVVVLEPVVAQLRPHAILFGA